MVRGEQFSAAKFEPLAAELGNAAIGLEQRFCGSGAEADDDFGSDGVDLPHEEWRAGPHFIFFGLAVFWRAALHHVADVDVFALQAHGFDHLREQFSCSPDERQSLSVFIGAGAFANKNQLGFGISIAEDNFVARAVELAARALAEVFASLEQRVARNLIHGFK